MVSAKFAPESRGFKRYAAAAAAKEYLSLEREVELAKRAKEGGILAVRAEQALVEAHLRQVIKVASGYRNYNHSLDTLTSVGNVGLVKAAKKFDPSKGFRFATYARWWIDAELKDFVVRNASMVKVPSTKQTKTAFFKAPKLRRELEAQGMDEDTVLDIMADRFGIDKAEMAAVLAARGTATSLSAPVNSVEDGSATVGDLIADDAPSPEEIIIQTDEQDDNVRRLNAVLSQLNERERDIIRSRRLVEEPLTLETLATRYSVSKERVRQIEEKAMGRVRQALLAA
ncbi:sigma-70 family RNA polymerase sigma factor [Rhizobium laguerreae]|uniref:sigma-70 family RNA polymerase sigma factor n=1 Tax=Rhizobium laguerreae TaxID=1076926 RepID=UPI001C9163D5|nr:sigma-70 family RNA polymerase sigma factor [Rhizobium laguerreae]MBY3151113.1 sigma-70 family RNA polymerase sigma factor [Rhizobium laguerreae]